MNDILVAEFRGLFWGEGCADIQRFHRPGAAFPLYRPRLRISMRSDELSMLEVIQQNFGGYINNHRSYRYPNHVTRPFASWQLSNRSQLAVVCDLLLDQTHLPSRKIREVELVRDVVRSGVCPGHKLGAEGRAAMEAAYQELRYMKLHSDVKVLSSGGTSSSSPL